MIGAIDPRSNVYRAKPAFQQGRPGVTTGRNAYQSNEPKFGCCGPISLSIYCGTAVALVVGGGLLLKKAFSGKKDAAPAN